MGEIWNGANPWGFFSQPQYPCTLSQDNLLLSLRATSQRLCGHGSKALHILNLSNRSQWSAPFSSQFTFGEFDPDTHWIRAGVAPNANVDMVVTQIKVQSSASNHHCYMCPIHVLPFTFRTLSIKKIYQFECRSTACLLPRMSVNSLIIFAHICAVGVIMML